MSAVVVVVAAVTLFVSVREELRTSALEIEKIEPGRATRWIGDVRDGLRVGIAKSLAVEENASQRGGPPEQDLRGESHWSRCMGEAPAPSQTTFEHPLDSLVLHHRSTQQVAPT